MAGAAGPGGIPGKPVEIDKELVDMMAVADNIHDFSGDRSNIPIPVIVEGRLRRDRYFEYLREIIGKNIKKPNNFEKQIQQFLERNNLIIPVIEDIFNYNSPEHTRFVDCNDNDRQNLEKVKGRDCIVFRVLVSRDSERKKYIDYLNRENLLFGLDILFEKAKELIEKDKDIVYLPIIFDASSFSPKNIFYILEPRSTNIITGVFGGILVEESTHSDSATKIINNNYRENRCENISFNELFNGETITFSMKDGELPKQKGIKLLVKHQNNLIENRLDRNIKEVKSIRDINKVEIPSDGPFKYYLINSNNYCNAGIIIEANRKFIIVETSVFGGLLFSVEDISNYYNGISGSESFDRIFDLLGIKDREIKLKILMDLKRCGDWGQVMMIKNSGNKAVLYTHDRMLFNFARYIKIPVIFTSFPNVNVDNEEDNNNSLYVDLICYTPNQNGIVDTNINNMIELAKEGIKKEQINKAIETLIEYREKLVEYFIVEVKSYKIPDDLELLNEMIGKLNFIRVRSASYNLSEGIPANLIEFLNSLEMFISIINFSYKVFIEFYNEVERINIEKDREGLDIIKERVNRQFTNYNVLVTMKDIKMIVKNLTTLFRKIEDTEFYEFRTAEITNIATTLFLGINLNTYFNNILYATIYGLENPKFSLQKLYSQTRIIVPIIKSLIENNREVEYKERLNFNNDNKDEFSVYIVTVKNLTRINLEEIGLIDNIRRVKSIRREIRGGSLGKYLEDYFKLGYIDLPNINVYYYTYLTRLLLEAIIINDSENKEILTDFLSRFNYDEILRIIGANIIENKEEIPERFFIMRPYEIIRGLEPEMLNNSPNTQLYIYTVLVNEYINNYRNPDIEVILETIEYLMLVYSEMIGIASINIVIGDAVLDKEITRSIEFPEVIIEKKTKKRILEPDEIEIVRPKYEAVDDYPRELRLEKPSILYSEMKRPRITAIGSEIYDGGKIRIMKNSMKNVYLDELEKNIIRWGIKKGYIHKSNYLDLEKLLKN